jgi:hypothetical protein
MTDLHLKFTDEAQATEALDGYEGSIDTIGIIYKRTGGTDEEPVMTALPGWHVNVRGPESEALTQFSVEVNTPVRVWA